MDAPAGPPDAAPAVSARGTPRGLHAALVVALLALTAVLAYTSLVRDSVTFDETAHVVAGLSYLKTGDFRISPEHPPLFRLWCALPLLFVEHRWPAEDYVFWREPDVFGLGRHFLFDLNDGQRLVVYSRCMMVLVFLGTCLTTYALARRLFGPCAGLLALALAGLSPALLAHGRLVTTDMPVTFCTALSLLAFAWLMERMTWPRLLTAGAVLATASVSKVSWPLVIPAVLVMGGVSSFKFRVSSSLSLDSKLETRNSRLETRDSKLATARSRPGPGARAALVAGSLLFIGLAVWIGIWTCYGWRWSVLAEPANAADAETDPTFEKTRAIVASWWQGAVYEPDGGPTRGVLPALLRFIADQHILPEPYTLGVALARGTTGERNAYFRGEYGLAGWRSYFPVVFAIKTPLPLLLLIGAGLAALVLRRARPRDPVLLAGAFAFIVVYGGYAILGALNIGERHLLPVYPLLYALGGAAAAWAAQPLGRILVGAAVFWLFAVTAAAHPQYLPYFNELVGGPANGHKFLTDSNIDWGQDLLRLADYARRHPDEPIKLCYFGSAKPTVYLDCTALPSYFDFAPRAALTPGTYVVSLTQLSGVYDLEVRDDYWTELHRAGYATLAAIAGGAELTDERIDREEARKEYEALRYCRLLARLRHRPPDERAGWSLLIYRNLTQADIDELTAP
ncbi:MAG: glycosyltransferase family 39 protein [Planctomycetota bacterium]